MFSYICKKMNVQSYRVKKFPWFFLQRGTWKWHLNCFFLRCSDGGSEIRKLHKNNNKFKFQLWSALSCPFMLVATNLTHPVIGFFWHKLYWYHSGNRTWVSYSSPHWQPRLCGTGCVIYVLQCMKCIISEWGVNHLRSAIQFCTNFLCLRRWKGPLVTAFACGYDSGCFHKQSCGR